MKTKSAKGTMVFKRTLKRLILLASMETKGLLDTMMSKKTLETLKPMVLMSLLGSMIPLALMILLEPRNFQSRRPR